MVTRSLLIKVLLLLKRRTLLLRGTLLSWGHYDESSWVKLVTEDYIEADNMLKDLRYSCKDSNYSYSLSMQEDRRVIPCNGTD